MRSRPLVLTVIAGSLLLLLASPAAARPAAPASWVQLAPDSSPPARAAQAMAYDRAARDVVVFGGYTATSYLNDTWTWKDGTWTQASPATPPPARAGAGIAYDLVAKQLVLFGGYDGHHDLGDTWTWDGRSREWTEEHPATLPKAVTGPMLFTDPISGRVDMIGGFDGVLFHSEMYQWTGSDWLRLHPDTVPYARGAGIATLDRQRRQVVLFGGIGDLNTYNTWTWDGTDWTLESPKDQPPQRFYSAADDDPGAGGVVLFGGGSADGDLADTWVWTGSDWSQLSLANPPSVRESQGMVFNGDDQVLLLFGGSSDGVVQSDTWSL